MPFVIAEPLLITIVALSILLMLWRPRGIPEVYWVSAGACLLVALRLVPLRLAIHAISEGSDVYLFLIGMMLLSELARENGVFDWVAATASHASRGSRGRLFALTYAVGIAVTACMSNDATAVVLTPAILTAVRRSKVDPLPYLFACAMIANAASFVLPISNPANLVVFHTAMPPLGSWLKAFLIPSLLSIATTFVVLRVWYRKELSGRIDEEEAEETVALDRYGKSVLVGIAVVVCVLLGASALKMDLGLPTCLAAIVITSAVCIQRRMNPLPLLREISWATLALVAALFVLVNAVETTGVLGTLEAGLHRIIAMGSISGALIASLVVATANNLVNNLPLGLAAGAIIARSHIPSLFTHVVLIGVDLGPNLSVTGSLATILWLLALRREGLHVKAIDFLKVGLIAMPAALLAAVLGLFLTQWVFGA
ncbi:arsenic transporter [Silvibacterium sp.]|uniref:arsenic transporter n=1 Tax=Silvibacterium sp. TaxID=1964179 RepID=UPI0039E50726